MKIPIDESIIGKTVCYFEKSMVSDKVHCHSRKVTGYMVSRELDGVKVTVRLDNGKWEDAGRLFSPENEEALRKIYGYI